ncbi:MAG: HAMP domain-containing histidine kinase [Ruminococcaceae bacterium]|nr:HAMP domain-containing histidine kinase [Oscillospiraceae bacterium]
MRSKHKPRIRTRLIWSLSSFVVIGLLLLFVFQSFFLDDWYEIGTVRTVKSAVKDIVAQLPEGDIREQADYWHMREGCDIFTVDALGQITYARGFEAELFGISKGELLAWYDIAEKQNGEVFQKLQIDFKRNQGNAQKPPERKPGGNESPKPVRRSWFGGEAAQSVIYGMLAEDGRLVMAMSVLTPVDAAVRVLQMQTVIATVVFVAMAVLLALFMAKYIASPIVHINRAAKTLSGGEYQPPPEGSYREVEELRETLSVINGELRKSEQLQRDLIANVSHDMRTPLTMIIGYSEAIRDLPGEDSAENIQVVIDEAERLTHLVNDVLDLSKLQSGVELFETAPVPLTELLKDTVSRVSTMVQPQGFTVVLETEEEATVSADDVRLSQIIYNLLLNALAHTGEDQRVVVRQTTENGTVRVSFTDSGRGIPEEELSNIWLRYYQVHSHDRRSKTMNSGLGLSIVYALVQRHGGICGVESEIGKGSTFWFELPLL